MRHEPVFNLTLEKTLQVGEIMKKVKISSTNKDISFDELNKFAELALQDQELVACPGVSIELNFTPNRNVLCEPMFTPAPDENISYMDCRPKGVSYGQITPAAVVKEQNESNRRREEIIGLYRGKLREAAVGYTLTREGFERAVEAVVCEAANIHRNMIMAADKDKDQYQSMLATNEKLLKEKKNLEEGMDNLLNKVAELNKQLSDHANTVDGIIQTRRQTEKELEGCKRENQELLRRLNVIRNFLDSIGHVI